MVWWQKYIGIAFVSGGRTMDGLDCGGLVMLAYKQERGRDIPDFDEQYHARAIRQASKGIKYVCQASFRRTDFPEPFAVAIFSRNHMPYHVALCVDKEHVIHAKEGEHVKRQRLDEMQDYPWLEGFYVPA